MDNLDNEELDVFGRPNTPETDQEEKGDLFEGLGIDMPNLGFAGEGPREIGIGEKLRKGLEAETGEKYTTGEAVASRMVPFVSGTQKHLANEKTKALESILEQYALDDIKALSPDEYAKTPDLVRRDGEDNTALYERRKKLAVAEAINKAGLKNSDIVKSPEFAAMSADDQLAALMPYAEEELKRQTGVKQEARRTLGSTRQGTWGKVVSGGVENTGYTLGYVLGSLTGSGFVLPAAMAAAERESDLTTNDYELDAQGQLVNKRNAYGKEEASLRAAAGGLLEAGVEVGLGAAVGLLGKGVAAGIAKLPGGAKTIAALGKAKGAVKGAAGKVPGVRALSWLGRQYDKVAAITQQHSWPEELAEEDVQAFIDNVIGLDKKKGEHQGLGEEWENYRRDTLSWNGQRDILVGMLGTMVVQGAYGAARGAQAQRGYDKAAQKVGGFTSKAANEARGWLEGHGVSRADVGGLSDSQAAFLANIGLGLQGMDEKELAELAEAHGKKVGELAGRLVRQRSFEYDQELAQRGETAEFAWPKDENGDTVWREGTVIDRETGEKKNVAVAIDENSGVAVRLDENDNYTVQDRRGNEQFVGPDPEMAYDYAQLFAKQGKVKDLQNQVKEAEAKRIVAERFGNGELQRFEFFNTANDYLEWLRANGATPEKIAKATAHVRTGDAGIRMSGAEGEPGRVAVILDNAKSINHLYEVMQHEVIGHNSLANRFGGTEGVLKFLRSLDSKTLKDYEQRLLDEGMDPAVLTSDEGIQELFARIVQDRRHNPLIRQRVMHALREIGRARGMKIAPDDADLEVVLAEMEKEAAQGDGSNVTVHESMSFDGLTFLRAEDAERADGGEAKTGDPAPETAEAVEGDRSDENFGRIRDGVERAMAAALGRTPTSTEIDDATARIIDAASWEEAMDAITALGLQDDTALFNAAKGWFGGAVEAERPGTARPSGLSEAETKQGEGEAKRSEEPKGGARFDSEASYHSKILAKVPVGEVELDTIEVDNKLVPNVKRNADPTTGETEPIQGTPIDLASNPIVVWETKDGRRVVATGRHRYWLYKRNGRKTIPARVIREADGWTQKDILVLDAMSNIIDKKGTVNDYYEFFRRITPTRAEASEARLLDTEIGRSAFSIYADATADTQGSVNWEEPTEYGDDRIPVEAAATIARILPKDANKYHAGAQRAVIDTVLKNPKMRGRRLEILARQLAWESKVKAERGEEAKKKGEYVQDDLFGADDSFMKEMAAIAEYRAKKAAEFRYDAGVFSNANRKSGDLALKGGKAAEYGITDVNDQKQIKKAYDIARAKERYWAEGELTPEDDAQMRKELGLPPKAGAEPAPEPEKEAPKAKEEPKTEPKAEPKEQPKEAPKKAPEAKKEPKPQQKKERKAKPKSSLDLGDAEGALDDALDGLDDAFGSFVISMSGFSLNATNAAEFDPEAFGRQVTAVGKVVNVLAGKGFTDFKSLATVIYEKKRDLWPKVKPHLRKVWNAIAEDRDYEEISKKDAEAVFAALEGGKEAPKAKEEPAPKEEPKEAPKAEPTPKGEPVSKEAPPAPEPKSGKKGGFSPDESGKVAFDLGGSEADKKEVADLIGDILFESTEFAIGLKAATLADGSSAAAPVATAPRQLTPAEKEHNRVVMDKLIRKLVSLGHNTFESFARALANASYKLYNAVKHTLRGYWGDAVNAGHVPEENDVTVREAKETIAQIDDELADALHVEPERADGRTQWSLKDQRDAYLAMTNRQFAVANPEAVKIANEMLAQGVPVSAFAKIEDWWTQDDAAYWPVSGLKIEKVEDAAALFQMLSNPFVEISKALYLDKNHRVLEGRVLGIGTRTCVKNPFDGIDKNVPEGTVGVIISHNHPTGNVVPSGPVSGQQGDIQATEYLMTMLNEKGLLLLDHIVTDTNRFTSMAVGASKGVAKAYGKMHFNINAAEYWNPKIVGRGIGLYEYPPLPWENVPRDELGLGFYDGRHSKSVATFFAQQLSTHNQDRSILVFLNDDQKIVAAVRVPTAEAMKKGEKLSDAVYDIIKEHPEAENAMLYVGRERFDIGEVGEAFMRTHRTGEKVRMRISAVYSVSKGKFIGEKGDTAESKKFKLPESGEMSSGYEDALFAGILPEIWDKDAKNNISRRVPRALPLEVLPKNRYTIQQRKGTDYDESDNRGDSGNGDGSGRREQPQAGSSEGQGGSNGMDGRIHPDGSMGGADDGRVPGEGQGSGMGAGEQNGSGQSGMGGGRDAGGGAEGVELPGDASGEQAALSEREDGGARDSVALPPGSPDTQSASDNFIATEKVLNAWERVDDESPEGLLDRAKLNIEALDALDSLMWEPTDDEETTDANIMAKRINAPQRTPTMEEKEQIACFTGWYGFKSFLGNDDYEAAYKQYQHFTEETAAAGIEPDEDSALKSAADRTNSLRSIEDDAVRAVDPEKLKIFKELREMLSENLQREIRNGQHDKAYNLSFNGAENAPAMSVGLETAILDAVSNAGLKGGYFINPLAGWGRDAALAGSRFAKDVNWTFFEPNRQKAQILRTLYPRANVFNTLYRNTYSVNNFYDFAITVAPQDESRAEKYDRRSEDYVEGATNTQNDIVKIVRQVRPGGVAAIVMPEMDVGQQEALARMVGMSNGRILGVLKVPAMYAGFSAKSGWWGGLRERAANDTQAVVMLVQRTTTRILNKDAVDKAEERLGGFKNEDVVGFAINEVGDEDERMLEATAYQTRSEFGSKVREAMARVMLRADSAQLSNPNAAPFAASPFAEARTSEDGHPERETFIEKGVIKIKEDGYIRKVRIGSAPKGTDKKESDFEFAVDGVTGMDALKALAVQRDYETLRKALNDALDADYKRAQNANEKKAALKKAYDSFVAKHGFVNSPANRKLIELDRFNAGRVFGMIQRRDRKDGSFESEYFAEFETPEGRKSYLEVNPFAQVTPNSIPENNEDAVRMSLRDKGFIDPTYIRDLLGMKTAREAMQKLLDERVVFIDPATQRYADRSEYLSGLVRTKYEAAKRASAIDSRFLANAEELQKIVKPITSFDAGNAADRPQVAARSGFVPMDIMKKFFRSVGIHGLDRLDYNKTAGRYIFLDDWKKVTLDNPQILRIGTNNDKAKHIKWWLNGKPAVVIDDDTKQVDDEASEDLNNAFAELDRRLTEFIMSERGYKAAVERAFSEQLQDEFVERDYSGYAVSLPGVSQMWQDRFMAPERFYQRRAVAGVFFGDTQLLDHNVGSGKTFEMIASMMAMKRFGKVKKPMMAVTNATVRQMHYDWMQIYPTAKLLVLETSDLSDPGKRLNTLALIRDNDWDGIIVPHRAFKEFGLSQGMIEGMIEDVSVDYDAELQALKRMYGVQDESMRGDRRRTTAEVEYDKQKKEVEDAKAAALAQYQTMLKDAKANRAVSFDETGVDYLAVDEAHYFKTVQAQTSKGEIRGVVTKGENSGLTKAMVPVCYHLNKMHGGRHGVLFATGTPLTNSFTEVYTMLNYLAPGLLREVGAPTLDSFLNEFCNFKIEFTPKIGGGFDAETVLSLANAYPLSKLFRHVADVALAGQDYKVKGLPNKREYIVQIPQSQVQEWSTLAIAEMANRLRDGEKLPGVNEGYLKNYLGRTVAINPYLLGIRDNASSRASAQAKIIKSFYDKNPNMHHVIFADLGAPKEFEYPQMANVGKDAFQIIGKNGRLIDVGPRNPYTGMRKLTATVEFQKDLSLTESMSTTWTYLDDVPGQSTGGAPFNPAALHMALAKLERKADVIFGKTKTVGARKRGQSVSTGDVRKKSKLTGKEKFDFKTALQRQITALGYDPRLTEATGPKTFMMPPLRNKELTKMLDQGGEKRLDEFLEATPMFQFYGAHTFDEYSQMVEELVKAGIPAGAIVMANNKDQVEAVREDFDSPKGRVKVLITGKAAQEGVNFQQVLWTLHNHDIPWMPGDKSQREGRIWRPGNKNNPVHIFNYITPDSADGRSYTIVTRKQKLLFQIQTRPDHNLQEDVGDDAGSLAEMAALAIADKRVYWQDRLEKALRRNNATVAGEERRIAEFEKSMRSFTGQRERQQQIVDEYRDELMPIYEKREAAKREFAIETPKGEKLTTTKEILEYLSEAARGTPDPVRRTAEEFTVGDYLTYLNFSEDGSENDINSVQDFLASDGLSKETALSEYYNQADLVHRMHVENYLDSESTGEKVVGSFYGAQVKIVSRFSNGSSENGGRKVLYTAEIEAVNAAMAMPMRPVMKEGRPDGEAPQGTEQGVQQMKGSATRMLNPVSDNRPVPKAVANAEDVLFDINERLKAAESGRANAMRSLEEAQGPIDSLERRLQMLHESFMADSTGGAQPKPDFLADLDKYMKDGGEDDEESLLYKVDGGAVLRDGEYDEAKHTKAPAKKGGKPTEPTTPGGGDRTGEMNFESNEFAIPRNRTYRVKVSGPSGLETFETTASTIMEAASNAKWNYANGDKRIIRDLDAWIVGVDEFKTFYDIIPSNENNEKLNKQLARKQGDRGSYARGGSSAGPVPAADRQRGAAAGRRGGDYRGGEPQRSGGGAGATVAGRAAEDLEGSLANSDNAYLVGRLEQATFNFETRAFEAAGADALLGIANAYQDAALTERGLKAPQKRVRGDAKVLEGAETLMSNAGFMEKLRRAVAKDPRALRAEENVALAEDWLKEKDRYDEIVKAHAEAIAAGDTEAARRLGRDKAASESKLVEIVKAREAGVGEAARTLRTNRFLFAKDYSYAGLVAQRTSDLGRPLTDAEYKELKDIADKLKKLDEEDRDTLLARIKAFADKAIRDFIAGAKTESSGKQRNVNEFRKMMRKRNEALAQIEVLAYEVGGEIGAIVPEGGSDELEGGSQFVSMRRHLRALAEYHVYQNPDITEAELIKALVDDISPYFTTDDHTVRQIFSGYGFSWQMDRNDRQRKVSDLTAQSRILEQILSLSNDELPKLTGAQREEPSETTRELMRIRDQMRRQKEREGVLPTSANHLKTALESAKTRYRHMIADIKAALDAGEKLPKREPLGVTDAELDAMRAEYARLRDEYDRIWGAEGYKLTDEQKRKIALAGLERSLARWVAALERARGGDFTRQTAKARMSDAEIEEFRRRIAEAKDEWMRLKAAAHPNGTPEEIREAAARRLEAVNRAIQRWQTAMITGDIGPKKRGDLPFPDEKSKAMYEAAVEQRKRLYRQILDMREHDKNRKTPLGLGYAKEYVAFVNNMMRSLLATADFSAMMRQTSALTTSHFATAVKTFFKTLGTVMKNGSPKATRIDRELRANPLVREAIDNGWLNWRNIEAWGDSNDVEMFHGVDSAAITIGKRKDGTERRISLGDIPGVEKVLHGSERQYATFINMMSAEIYTKILRSPAWGSKGPSDLQKKAIAAYINMANGSAQLGANGKMAMNTLTHIFWAPKLAVSRLQLATGAGVLYPFLAGEKGDATMGERARAAGILAVEQGRAFLGAAAAGFLLFALFGDDDDKYEMEQASAIDKALMGMKPRIGSTTLDMTGGVEQWWRLLRMMMTGTKRTATGKEIDLRNTYGRSLTQEMFRFAQGKFSPLLSNTIALAEGRDYVGNEFGVGDLLKNSVIPLAERDVWNALSNENNGLGRGLLLAPFILAGAGGPSFDVDRFSVAKNEFTARQKEYKAAMKAGDYARMKELISEFPELKQAGRLEALFDSAKKVEAMIAKRQKRGLPESPVLEDLLRRRREAALEAFRSLR